MQAFVGRRSLMQLPFLATVGPQTYQGFSSAHGTNREARKPFAHEAGSRLVSQKAHIRSFIITLPMLFWAFLIVMGSGDPKPRSQRVHPESAPWSLPPPTLLMGPQTPIKIIKAPIVRFWRRLLELLLSGYKVRYPVWRNASIVHGKFPKRVHVFNYKVL